MPRRRPRFARFSRRRWPDMDGWWRARHPGGAVPANSRRTHHHPRAGSVDVRVVALREKRHSTTAARHARNGRRALVSSSGARPLHRRGRARVGAARSRCRGQQRCFQRESISRGRAIQCLLIFARMTGSKRRRTPIARRGRSMGATVRAAPPRRCNLESRRPRAGHGTRGSPRHEECWLLLTRERSPLIRGGVVGVAGARDALPRGAL
jgi:hypothetical protein